MYVTKVLNFKILKWDMLTQVVSEVSMTEEFRHLNAERSRSFFKSFYQASVLEEEKTFAEKST